MLALPRFRNRPEPQLDRQPLALEHLRDMARALSRSVLSNDAYGAFLTLAASRVRIADAHTHADGEWALKLRGAYLWRECRFSPGRWLTVPRHLASEYPKGQLGSLYENVVRANRRVRWKVGA